MPIYDYQCRNCGHRVEVIHGVNASGPSTCEQCGGPMKKLLTTPSIVFKGSGWAKKDRSSASSGSKSSDSSTSSASGESTAKSSSAGSKSGEGSGGGERSGGGEGSAGSSTSDKSETKTPAKDTTSAGGTGPTD